jgi:predicted dehydrogenase
VRLEPHIGVLQGFIDGIHEARPPDVPGEAGRAAVAICEACVRSAAARQAVDVAPG